MTDPILPMAGTAHALASVEVSPGIYQLMIGSLHGNEPILVRDSNFILTADNGVAYEANAVIGAIGLAQPGEVAELGFITAEFAKTASQPGIYVLLEEIDGALSAWSLLTSNVSDPPILFGATGSPATLYSNRYYFKQTVGGVEPIPAYCRFMNVFIDFSNVNEASEVYSTTIFGSILVENT